MATGTSGRSNRFTSSLGDYYPITQFKQLSQHVSAKSRNRPRTAASANYPVSPREEIYRSLIKQIRSKESPNLNSLVKKASGLLRLSHVLPEGSIEGATFSSNSSRNKRNKAPDKIGKRTPAFNKADNESVDAAKSISEIEIKSLGMIPSELIAQLARNGGDFSELWDYIEDSAQDFKFNISAPSTSSSLAKSMSSRNTNDSRSTQAKKPAWRYFGNQKALSSSSNTSVGSIRSTESSDYTGKISTNPKYRSRPSTANSVKVQEETKVEYVKHVFAIKGQVVTFKGEGFENFTNWFGDMTLLKSNSAGNVHSRFRRDLDLSGFSNQEIRMKLFEGYKLVIEAFRPLRDGLPPLRFKTTILLPKSVKVENLIMCRTSFGRLIIQDTMRPSTGTSS